MADQHSLLRWFPSVGIELHSSLYLEHDPLTGLSFYTDAPLPPDTTVIRVPKRICITCNSAFERIQLLVQQLSGSSSLQLDQDALPAPDWILFYLVLSRIAGEFLATNTDAELSGVFEHLPYVSHIPEVISTPLHFSTAELALLANTPLVGSTERRLRETIVDYERARALLVPHISERHGFASYLSSTLQPIPAFQTASDPLLASTHHTALELWRWAESAFTSRSFPPRLIQSASTAPILIPGYDTFNHARAHPVTWSCNDQDQVCMTLNYASAGGGQVYNNYGGKSNEEFLAGYAFTLDSASEDTLALRLPGEGAPTHYWHVPAHQVQEEVAEEQVRLFAKGVCPCPTLLADLEAHILQGQPAPVDHQDSLELYASVLETLEGLLLAKRKAFRQSQSRFDATTPSAATVQTYNRADANLIRAHVYANVKQYRKGQLELLNHAVKWTRAELESVVDVLDVQDEFEEQDEV